MRRVFQQVLPAGSLLEKSVRHVAGRLLARDVGLEAGDLLLEERNARLHLADREQRQILAYVVDDLFLRPILVVHRGTHADLACCTLRGSRKPSRSSRPSTSSWKKSISSR